MYLCPLKIFSFSANWSTGKKTLEFLVSHIQHNVHLHARVYLASSGIFQMQKVQVRATEVSKSPWKSLAQVPLKLSYMCVPFLLLYK